MPNAIGHSKKGPEYRYLVKRSVIDHQLGLSGVDEAPELPFPAMKMKNKSYKIFGIVTNMGRELGKEADEGYPFQIDQSSCRDSGLFKPVMDKAVRESSIPGIVFIDTKQDSCAESGAIGLVTGSFKLEKRKRQERCA